MSGQNRPYHESRRPLRRTLENTWDGLRELCRCNNENLHGQIFQFELQDMMTENYAHDISSPMNRTQQQSDENLDVHAGYNEFRLQIIGTEWQTAINQAVQQYIASVAVQYPVRAGSGGYENEYTCCPPSLGMITISIVQVVLFLVDFFNEDTVAPMGLITSKLIYSPFKRFEVWRFFTYMFVHVGVTHLVVNLLVQLLLGIPLEMVHRWWRVLLVYFSGVLAGSLVTSITDPNVYLAGSSGGVYAILSAHIATIIMNWSAMKFAKFQLVLILGLVTVDTGSSIYEYFFNKDQRTGYSMHFAGALAGLLVGFNILRRLQKSTWQKKCWWASIIIYVVLMVGAILLNIFYTVYFPPSQ